MAQPRKPELSSAPVSALDEAKDSELRGSDALLRALVQTTLRWADDRILSKGYPIRQRLLVDLANLRGEDAINWFWQQRRFLWPESPQDLIELRDQLRIVWRIDEARRLWLAGHPTNSKRKRVSATEVSADELSAEETLNKWLRWRSSAEQEETRKSLDRDLAASVSGASIVREIFDEQDLLDLAKLPPSSVDIPFRCSLLSCRLVPEPRNVRAMLIQGIFEHWGHLKYCANPNCLTPYFIAKRKDQSVCDAEICKAEKQREHARNWWNENRAKKNQKSLAGKATKKGSKDNGPRKTR